MQIYVFKNERFFEIHKIAVAKLFEYIKNFIKGK